MSETEPTEIDRILQKIEGEVLPHVSQQERSAAVGRAIHLLHIDSQMSIQTLVEVIDTNEEQMGVHSQPSD